MINVSTHISEAVCWAFLCPGGNLARTPAWLECAGLQVRRWISPLGLFWLGSQGMSGDPVCCRGTYEGHTLLKALGRKLSTLATQAEFPKVMLSQTRHLVSGKWRREQAEVGGGHRSWGTKGGQLKEGMWMIERGKAECNWMWIQFV